MRDRMIAMVKQAQDEICDAISSIDDSDYREDEWTREGGGGAEAEFFPPVRFSTKQEST